MSNVQKAKDGLISGSHFGGETNMIFDGLEVREMTSKEKSLLVKQRESSLAGGELLDETINSEVVKQGTSKDEKK